MIIHSVVPLELIFENYEQNGKQKLREIALGEGVKMLVEENGEYEGTVVRLISPNPQDYLNPRFAPGQKITFRPDIS
ncbi:YlzJ-like family protein [Brevibacillus humidisoli]|uniref:YlzJ-like family protein n=1 Tax=Brevibacillus humidisoli TaxID=2895522 RepID=UPI001E4C5315|nr:YlzJ-like family protein [Brevibacillus humidisoli]UFJ42188.1 YlzJ-like family protein [Brevibacillus humidisoli]